MTRSEAEQRRMFELAKKTAIRQGCTPEWWREVDLRPVTPYDHAFARSILQHPEAWRDTTLVHVAKGVVRLPVGLREYLGYLPSLATHETLPECLEWWLTNHLHRTEFYNQPAALGLAAFANEKEWETISGVQGKLAATPYLAISRWSIQCLHRAWPNVAAVKAFEPDFVAESDGVHRVLGSEESFRFVQSWYEANSWLRG